MGSADAVSWTWAELRGSCVLVEDDDILVLDKPAGISVMGERHDDDVVELAGRDGERLFPVHRIDKVTSGVVLLAKTLAAHGPLTRQFAERSVAKGYLAVVEGADLPDRWTIDLPLSVGRKNRVRIAAQRDRLVHDRGTGLWSVRPEDVLTGKPTYPSLTQVHRLWTSRGRTLLLARPLTGRRHQIRVHLAWTGTAIVGDPLFRSPTADTRPAGRAHLHSWRLHLPAGPRPGRELDVRADPGADFLLPLTDGADASDALASAMAVAVAAWAGRAPTPPQERTVERAPGRPTT